MTVTNEEILEAVSQLTQQQKELNATITSLAEKVDKLQSVTDNGDNFIYQTLSEIKDRLDEIQ